MNHLPMRSCAERRPWLTSAWSAAQSAALALGAHRSEASRIPRPAEAGGAGLFVATKLPSGVQSARFVEATIV